MKRIVIIVWNLCIICVVMKPVALKANPAATFQAADFGAMANDGKDDGDAVRKMLAAATGISGPAVIRFKPGRYDFFKPTASTIRLPVTAVHLQWDFVTPFLLNGVKRLTIDGGGSTFMMHGRMTPWVLNACEDITIRGISIEHERPAVFEATIARKSDSSAEYEIHPDDRFVIEGNRLHWLDADDQRQDATVTQAYNPANDSTWRCADPINSAAASITSLGNHRIIVRYPPESKVLRSIQPDFTYQFRHSIRNQSGAVIFECQDVTFEDMAIHSWNGLGFVGQFSRNVTLRNIRMEPRTGSGRTNAGFADGIQMMNCQGRIIIEKCRLFGMHDDHINIYGQMMKVSSLESPQVVRAVFTSGETQGYRNFRPGDLIRFRDPANLAEVGTGRIVNAALVDDKTMRLEFSGPIQGLAKGAWVENQSWIPDQVIIRGNELGRVPTRSILLYLARQAIIEDNVFHRIPMSSILIQCPDESYALQNSVGALIVHNNRFEECAGPVIRTNPQVKELSTNARLYGSLLVEGNRISMKQSSSLFLDVRGFQSVTMGENRFEVNLPSPHLASLTDCVDVVLKPQLLSGKPGNPKVACVRVGNERIDQWER